MKTKAKADHSKFAKRLNRIHRRHCAMNTVGYKHHGEHMVLNDDGLFFARNKVRQAPYLPTIPRVANAAGVMVKRPDMMYARGRIVPKGLQK